MNAGGGETSPTPPGVDYQYSKVPYLVTAVSTEREVRWVLIDLDWITGGCLMKALGSMVAHETSRVCVLHCQLSEQRTAKN